ncbi:integrin alpha-4 isoform X1 [Bufo bufo]|uniref:integrin alpha-4 isoform X1 n=1 Tax=Bufo bufo TaxID=8384 RepID=UPI001ABDD69F|nr:integrin alpha-4 isoform X1 [Bufo bufo]
MIMKRGEGCKLFKVPHIWSLTLICVLTTDPAGTYNIDEENPLVFKGPDGSLFGYSVVFHSYGDEKWIIVGAPKSNLTTRTNIVSPGTIFKCKIGDNINRTCELMDVGEPNGLKCGRTCIAEQDNQWMGVSLSRQPTKDGNLLVCGHRWKNVHFMNEHKLPLGVCYSIPANLRTDLSRKICPCYRDHVKKFGEQHGSCQAGISTFYLDDLIIMGAPGSFYWTGAIFVYNTTVNKIYTYNNINNTVKYGSYLGYSVGGGNFQSSTSNDIIGGAPQQEQIGRVYIFAFERNHLIILFEAEGKKLGSYFGASVCAVDLNGDGLSDLLVGAPMESTVREEGKVYVYMNYGWGQMSELDYELSGSDLYAARFGEAITNLGDLDNDGYEDVAIGAPHEENMNGAVYIYNGRAKGITPSFTQRIQGRKLGYSLSTFGQSLSTGLDADGNGYQDVAVGAFLSDSAVLLRTRPVVTIDAALKLPSSVNRTRFECVENGQPAVCMNVTICFKYQGQGVPGHIVMHYNISSDVKRNRGTPSRFYFSSNGTTEVYSGKIDLRQKSESCRSHQAFMRKDVRDILTPIHMESHYHLGKHIVYKRNADEFKPLQPILQKKDGDKNIIKNVVSFARYCALANCSADLQISGKVSFPRSSDNKTYVVVGGTKTVMINMSLYNAGDDAYQSTLHMRLPKGIFFIKVLDLLEKQINCAVNDEENQLTRLDCNIGHLYVDSFSRQEFSFLLDTSSLTTAEDLEINVTVSCQNEVDESSLWNNEVIFTIPTRYEVNVNVIGYVSPISFVFGPPEDENKLCVKETIEYTFNVINAGPSLVSNTTFQIMIPNRFAPRDFKLFHILNVKTNLGKCRYASDTNVCDSSLSNRSIFSDLVSFFRRSGARNAYCFEDDETCLRIDCTFGDMESDTEATVEVTIETNHALLELEDVSSLQFITTGKVRSEENPKIIYLNQKHYTHVLQEAVHNQKQRRHVIYTIIGISLLLGLLLFSLMTFILWKMGFFKRKYKPWNSDMSRKESWSFLTQEENDEKEN